MQLVSLFATLLISTSFPVSAAISGKLDSLLLTLYRFALAALLFTPLILLRHRQRPPLVQLARYGLLGGCLAGFFWCMFEALRDTTPLNTSALYTLVPGLAGVFGIWLCRERLGSVRAIALAMGAVGAVCVVFRGDWNLLVQLQWNRGDLTFLAGCLLFSLYSPLVRRFYNGEPMVVMTFYTLTFGCLWLLLLFLADPSEPGELTTGVVAGIAYLAIFTTLFTFYIFQYSTVVLGPTRVMSFSYLVPALVLTQDLIMGGPLPNAVTVAGIAITASATVVLQRGAP